MKGLSHLAFRSGQVDRLVAFYTALFGLPVVRRAPDRAWLGLGPGAVLMLEPADPGEPTVPPGTMDFVAFATDPAGLDALTARCAILGVAIEHRTAWTVYVRDPDGRRVGASAYPFDGAETGAETGKGS